MSLEVSAITADLAALRASLAGLEAALAANESWRALTQLERRINDGQPLEVIDARAMKARLEAALALEPSFRSWRRLSDLVAEIERRLQMEVSARVDWTAIAARAAATPTREAGATSFRTRFRAKLNGAPRPSIADLLAKGRALGAPKPEPEVAPAAKVTPADAPQRPRAEHAVALVLDQLRDVALAQPERARSAARGLEPAPALRVTRLAERLAEAQPDAADGHNAPEPLRAPAPPCGLEPADAATEKTPGDSVARLEAIETEIDALVLSMGGNAKIPAMPLAARSASLVDRATGEREAEPSTPPPSAPTTMGREPEETERGRGSHEGVEDFDIDAGDEAEAQVRIVPGPAPAASMAHAAGAPARSGPGARLEAQTRLASRDRAMPGLGYADHRGSVEDATVAIFPAGSEITELPEPQPLQSKKEGAVARFLALLDGRRPS
jgi:hypothetical protein